MGVKNKTNAKLSPSFAGIGAWAELGNSFDIYFKISLSAKNPYIADKKS